MDKLTVGVCRKEYIIQFIGPAQHVCCDTMRTPIVGGAWSETLKEFKNHTRGDITVTPINDEMCRYSAHGIVAMLQPQRYDSDLVSGDTATPRELIFELEGSDWKYPGIWLQEIDGPNTLGNFPKKEVEEG